MQGLLGSFGELWFAARRICITVVVVALVVGAITLALT